MAAGNIPYWRLSAFYFFYFAVLGTWLPYWGLYLQELGYPAVEIGVLGAIAMGTKVFAPSLWGWLASKTKRRMAVIRMGSLVATLAFTGIFFGSGFYWLCGVVALYSFFWNAVLAQFEVVTLAHLGEQFARYSRIRVWGSIGFIVAVIALGWVFEQTGLSTVPLVIALLLAGIFASSLLVKEVKSAAEANGDGAPLGSVLRQPVILVFFLICFLLQVSHGPYYTFFSIYLEQHGYSTSVTGFLWSLGVLAEVVLFIGMHGILSRFSLRDIMLWSLALSAIRWWLIADQVDSLSLLLTAQILHAASFASFHAIAVEIIRRLFGEHQGQGMALYSGLSFGAGGAVGAVLSGWLWEFSEAMTFIMAAAVCALAWLLALIGMRGQVLEQRAPDNLGLSGDMQ